MLWIPLFTEIAFVIMVSCPPVLYMEAVKFDSRLYHSFMKGGNVMRRVILIGMVSMVLYTVATTMTVSGHESRPFKSGVV